MLIGTARHWRISNGVSVKVPRNFVHAKMYISGQMAMIGSANLTYSGMHRNIEHMSVIRSSREIGRLASQFWELWGNS